MRMLGLLMAGLICLPAEAEPRVDPKLISIHPFMGSAGSTFVATVRGSGLGGATSVRMETAQWEIAIQDVQAEPARESGARSKTPIELVTLRVTVREGT